MPTVTGLTVIKSFMYRGAPEEWSNKYWLTGAIPADDTAWRSLAAEIAGHEKTCYPSSTKIVRYYGYNDSDSHADAVFMQDLTAEAAEIPGTLTDNPGTGPMAGDQAGLVQWKTSRKSSRGKWIYLRKFFHDGYIITAQPDTIGGLTKSAYNAFAVTMANGGLTGGRIIRGPLQDEVLQAGAGASDWVTTRTLKRRGKRPRTQTTP